MVAVFPAGGGRIAGSARGATPARSARRRGSHGTRRRGHHLLQRVTGPRLRALAGGRSKTIDRRAARREMANVFAVHSVGSSITTFLRNTYPQQIAGRNMPACGFELTSSRQTRRAAAPADSFVPLGLDLHYLLTAWAANPLDEQATLAWAIRQLHQYPVLDASSLSPEAGWASDEVIQIIPAELTTEDVMRIWDALDPAYRISVSYVARLVRLDPDQDTEQFRPVVAGRYSYGEDASK